MNKKIIGILICTLFFGTIFTIGLNAEYNNNVVTDFHNNLEGWTIEGDGTATWKPCIRLMRVHDNGESIQILAVAPSKFHGNWNNYYKISISLKRISPTNPDQSPWYYISGPGGSAQCHGNERPGGGWTTCQVLLQESYWTVTSGLWDNLISNIASFKIDIEMDDSGVEDIDVDNIILYSTGGGAPYTPKDPNPDNHATNVDINTDLSWIGGDPESGDSVKYDVYFEANNSTPNALVSFHQSGVSFDLGTMDYNTKYYWRIDAVDNHGVSTTGLIWDFITSSGPNNPPYIPRNPYPENGSINITINTVLTWSGGDPDAGDTVTYDVYFGGMLPIQKIASNISNTSINPGNLVNNLTYFWNVVAWDNHNASTIGPGWYFTTINPDINPPNKPGTPSGQTKGKKGQIYSYTTSTIDLDGDQVYYLWDWGDGNFSEWHKLYNSGELANASHAWAKGTYNISVKAKDTYGRESVWSDPLAISISMIKIYNPIIQQILKMLERFPFFEKIHNQYL